MTSLYLYIDRLDNNHQWFFVDICSDINHNLLFQEEMLIWNRHKAMMASKYNSGDIHLLPPCRWKKRVYMHWPMKTYHRSRNTTSPGNYFACYVQITVAITCFYIPMQRWTKHWKNYFQVLRIIHKHVALSHKAIIKQCCLRSIWITYYSDVFNKNIHLISNDFW